MTLRTHVWLRTTAACLCSGGVAISFRDPGGSLFLHVISFVMFVTTLVLLFDMIEQYRREDRNAKSR